MNYPSRNRRIVYLATEVCLYTFHGIHGIPSFYRFGKASVFGKRYSIGGKKATPIFPATYKIECNESREVLSRRVLP